MILNSYENFKGDINLVFFVPHLSIFSKYGRLGGASPLPATQALKFSESFQRNVQFRF